MSSKRLLYYVPFLSLERMHLNKPPVQIPIHLAKNGFNVALMVSEADAAIDSKIIIKETLNKGDSQRINKSLTENINEMYQALHFITSFEPEISIFQGNYLTSVFLVFIFRIYYYLFPKKVIKSRFILKLDWDGEFQNFPRLIRFPFVFTLFMSALLYDSLSVETECAYDRLVNFPLIRKKIRLFPNTVADSYFPPKPYNNGKREKVIITVSRVMFSKGIDSLVRLFIEVNKQVPGWNLVIIGPIIDANYFNQLQTLIKESNLNEQIHFTNSLPYSEIKHYYEIASIFCLLSHGESFALSRLEAIMSGIPVLTTYSACGSRLKGAISVHISEVEKLAKSLLILMTNESRREELVKHGQEDVKQWEIVIKHFLEL